jgi:hypothetical protein
MTVNERLFVAGFVAAFDEAIMRRDRATLIQLLTSVEIDREDAEGIVRKMSENPAKYGYG